MTLFIGAALGFAGGRFWHQFGAVGPVTVVVGQAGINAAMAKAHPGDTVLIPAGKYSERVQLREGVALRAQQPDTVTISAPDGGPVVVAREIESGSLEGVWLQGAGIELRDASPTISNTRISGAQIGISIMGHSEPNILACQIENNLGDGVFVGAGAKPKIERNLIAANGDGKPGPAKPGVEVAESAKPVLKDNAIVNNGSEPVWVHGKAYQPADFDENFFGALTAKDAVRLVDLPPVDEEKPRPARPKPGAKK
jgi:hypothetical protein